MEIEEAAALQRDQARDSRSAASPRSATSSASTSRPSRASTPDTINVNFEIGREADRHVPGRRGLLEHRELHRHGAGAAGEPLRQRAVARAPGAGLRAPAARRRPLLRAVLPRHRLVDVAPSSSTSSASTPTSRADRSAARSPSATRSSSRSCASSLTDTRRARHGRHVARRRRSSADRRRRLSVFQRLPLANLFNDGVTLAPPGAHLRHARQPALPVVRHLSPGVDRARRRARSAARSSSSATASPAASTTRSAADASSRARLRPQAQHRGRRRHEPRARRACRSSRASSSAASSTCAASRLRSIGPRLPLKSSLDVERAADPERREHRRQPEVLPEPRARVPDHRQGRHPRRRLHRRGQRLEHSRAVLQRRAGPAVLDRRQPLLRRRRASSTPHVVGLRHPLVLAARPAALRVGLPVQAAPVRAGRASSSSPSATSSNLSGRPHRTRGTLRNGARAFSSKTRVDRRGARGPRRKSDPHRAAARRETGMRA